jgi:cytochrome c553
LGRGRTIYDHYCIECHGRAGEGREAGPVPAVAAQNYTFLVNRLRSFAFLHSAEDDPTLLNLVSGFSADDRRAVADFLSRLPESADPRYGVILATPLRPRSLE